MNPATPAQVMLAGNLRRFIFNCFRTGKLKGTHHEILYYRALSKIETERLLPMTTAQKLENELEITPATTRDELHERSCRISELLKPDVAPKAEVPVLFAELFRIQVEGVCKAREYNTAQALYMNIIVREYRRLTAGASL